MSPTASTADWNALQGAIAGEVVLPGAPRYEELRRPALARYWDVRPAAIVRCRTAGDVLETLALARRAGLPLAVRSGGHCFAGRSSGPGIVLDVGPMNAVMLADGIADVGAGARLGEVYDALDGEGRTIAAGCGATVGIAGLTLGGGLGILGRQHGLTADQLVEAEVVLADGRIVRCDERHEPELFWALRGAGGGRFGVVTRLALRTVPAPAATAFDLRWPPRALAAVLGVWQSWAPDAPDEMAASLLATAPADADRPVDVKVFGAMTGSEAEARGLLGELVARVGVDPASSVFTHRPYRQVKHYLAEDTAGPGAKPEPGHAYAKSEFFRGPLPEAAIEALVAHLGSGRAPGQARELDFSPWGGAYDRVRTDATAFAHRRERFLLKHEAVIAVDAGPGAAVAAREWAARSWALAHPAGTGGAYPNFADPELGAWDRAYHGANRERLLRAKARYDPDGVLGSDDGAGVSRTPPPSPPAPRARGRTGTA